MPRKKLITKLKQSNWQTSAAAALTLLCGGAVIYGQATGRPDIAAIGQTGATLFGAGGLLAAKDHNK